MGMGIERGAFDGLKDERRKGERGVSLFEVDSLRLSEDDPTRSYPYTLRFQVKKVCKPHDIVLEIFVRSYGWSNQQPLRVHCDPNRQGP